MDSALLAHLSGASLRALAVALTAFALLRALRVRSAPLQHAVWITVLAAMLLFGLAGPWLPVWALPILPSAGDPAPPPESTALTSSRLTSSSTGTSPEALSFGWTTLAIALWLAGVVVMLARIGAAQVVVARLRRDGAPTGMPDARESHRVTVPVSAGVLRPVILLPPAWRAWSESKLEAVLAHERTHIRRRDGLVILLARLNKSIFWFHPVAWWLERELARLAERICDDCCILTLGDRERYAQVLVEVAQSLAPGGRRLLSGSLAMARSSKVSYRVDAILDSARELRTQLPRRAAVLLAICGVPLLYFAAVAQPVPRNVSQGVNEVQLLSDGYHLTAVDVAKLEAQLKTNPDDEQVRGKLIGHYYMNAMREPRLRHLLWLIERHPESELHRFSGSRISEGRTPLDEPGDWERAKALWLQQVDRNPQNAAVLGNAAYFLTGHDDRYALDLLKRARQAEPDNPRWAVQLRQVYTRMIDAGDERARQELEASNDPTLKSLPPSGVNVMPRTNSASSAGAGLQVSGSTQQQKLVNQVKPVYPPLAKQARIQGTVRFNVIIDKDGRVDNVTVVSGHPLLVPSALEAVRQWQYQPTLLNGQPVAVSTTVDVNFTLNEPYEAALPAPALTAGQPKVLNKVQPVYPPLAKQARIQGTVYLRAAIANDGHVDNVTLISGHPLLAPAAIEAVKQWVYEPGAATVDVPVTFSLANEEIPQAQAAGPMRIRVGGMVQQAKRDHFVQPTYPPLAKQSDIEGTVRLNIIVDKEGRVQSADPVSGHPLLVPAAIEAVKQWTYQPTLLNGNPVEVVTIVDVNFSLSQE